DAQRRAFRCRQSRWRAQTYLPQFWYRRFRRKLLRDRFGAMEKEQRLSPSLFARWKRPGACRALWIRQWTGIVRGRENPLYGGKQYELSISLLINCGRRRQRA